MTNRREGSQVPLFYVWHVLVKRRWLIGTFASVVMLTVFVATLFATRYYAAVATIEISPNAPMVLDVDEVTSMGVSHWDVARYYRTQYRIITSRAVLEEAARRLQEEHGVEGLGESPTGYLAGGLDVVPESETHLVKIRFEDPDPDLAAVCANTVAQAYIDMNVQRALDASEQALNWLREQQEEYRSRQFKSDEKIEEFKSQHGLVGDQVEDQNASLEKLSKLQEAWSTAHTQRLQVQSQYEALIRLRRTQGHAAVANTLVDYKSVLHETLARLEQAKQERAALLSRYKEGMPKVQRATEEITALEEQLKAHVDAILNAKKAELKLAESEEDTLAKELESVELEVTDLGSKLIELKFLRSEMERNKQFYQDLDMRLAEVGLARVLPINNISMVDEARPNRAPVRPHMSYNLILGLLVGSFGGLVLAFGVEYLDSSVKSREDVETIVGVPFLGAVARVAPDQMQGLSETDRHVFVHARPRSTVAEALRLIRTAVQFSAPGGKPIRRIVVSSAVPREGKSFVTANLSAIIGMSGQKVLAIDGDMRRPTLHNLFGARNDMGLLNVLAGDAAAHEVILPTHVEGVHLMPAGTGVPNPAELLDVEVIEKVFSMLGETYDLMIIDSPPVNIVGDAMVLASVVDGVVFVIEANRTSRKLAADGCERLMSVNNNLLGGVVNKLDLGAARYGYDYGYGYGYGYGYYHGGYYAADDEEEDGAKEPETS